MTARPKHLRPRWRYLAVEVRAWPDAEVDRRGLQGALWRAARSLLGDPGSATAALTVVSFAYRDGRGEAAVRIRRGSETPARASVACVSEIDGHPVALAVLGISGTLRGVREKYLGRHRQPTGERTVVFENVERTAITHPDGVDLRLDDAFAGATSFDLA